MVWLGENPGWWLHVEHDDVQRIIDEFQDTPVQFPLRHLKCYVNPLDDADSAIYAFRTQNEYHLFWLFWIVSSYPDKFFLSSKGEFRKGVRFVERFNAKFVYFLANGSSLFIILIFLSAKQIHRLGVRSPFQKFFSVDLIHALQDFVCTK